jgi:hypothetical protein
MCISVVFADRLTLYPCKLSWVKTRFLNTHNFLSFIIHLYVNYNIKKTCTLLLWFQLSKIVWNVDYGLWIIDVAWGDLIGHSNQFTMVCYIVGS